MRCSRRLIWIGHKDCARRLATDALVDWRRIGHIVLQRLCSYFLASALLEKIVLDWPQRLCSWIGDKDCGRQLQRLARRLLTDGLVDWRRIGHIVLVDWQQMRSSIGDGLGTKIVRQMLSSIGDGLGTKIVFVIFGNCYAREDCSGCARRLATKIVVVKCYSQVTIHVHYVESVDSLTATIGDKKGSF